MTAAPTAKRRLAGRDQELAAVGERLRTGQSVLLTGPAGIGKSALARQAVSTLAGEGWSIDSVHGTASTRGIPYGALAHLLPTTMPAEVVNPVRWAVERLSEGRRPRRILLVDDAHQLDPASAAVVHQLAEQRRTALLATVRDGEDPPDAIAVLVRSGTAERMELAPLTEADTGRVLRGLLGDEVEQPAAQRLWLLSEGNPLLLQELVLAARDSAALVGPPWRLVRTAPIHGNRLVELVEARVGALNDAEADVLDYVAIAEPLAAADLQKLCPYDAIERCERRQLIRMTGRRLEARLAHPIYGEVVRSGDRPLGLKRRYQALVQALEDSAEPPTDRLRLAIWRLEAELPQDATTLLAAARIAWAAHDYPQATRLAGAAVEAGGGVEPTTLLATLHVYAGHPERAAEVLDALVDTDGISAKQFTDLTLTRANSLAGIGRFDDAHAELSRVQAQLDEIELRQNLEAFRIALLAVTGDIPLILEMTQTFLNAPPATPPLLAQALNFHAAALGLAGRFQECADAARAALATIDEWRDAVPVMVVPLHMSWSTAALSCGDLAEAERALEGLEQETAGRLGWEMADNALLLGRTQLLMARGRVADAATLASSAQQGPMQAACEALLALALALSGDAGGAARALESARAGGASILGPLGAQLMAAAEAWTLAAGGDVEAAVRTCVTTARELLGTGLTSIAAGQLYNAVRLGSGSEVVDLLTDMVAQMQGGFAPLMAAHARAAADRDGPALLALADRFDGLGFLPSAAEAAAQAAEALSLRYGRGSSEARRANARAAALVARCQGLDTPAVRRLAAPELSDRERQVARMAAAGRTSQQIADELVLSVRTVENHLQHAYTKLGVSGRAELGGLL